MHIRCERCATLYELDESLIAPEGSPVQCAKCDHVFTASPPRAPEARAEVRPEPRAEVQPPPAADEVAEAPASPVTSGGAASGGGGRPLADWDSAPPVYRGSPPVGLRAPLLRQNPVGAFESRLRWMARARWLVPTVAVALLAAGGAGFWLVRARAHRAADPARGDRAASASARHDGPRRAEPAPSSAAMAPAAPAAPQPPAGPAGNDEPSPRKAVALHAAPSGSPSSEPAHPGPGDAAPATAGEPVAAPAPERPAASAAAAPRRRRAAGPLAPAALPELAPESAAPEIEPPSLDGAAAEPRTESNVREGEAVGGG